jgi:hypothetical protein
MEEKNETSMKINFVDEYHYGVKGTLNYKVFRHVGDRKVLIEEFEDHNLIVNVARVQMAHLTAGDYAQRRVKQIAFGTNGTPPAVTDTSIANPYYKDMDGFEYPEGGKVRFRWSLSISEANGKAISEFGLFVENGGLYARRVRQSPLNKESDISLEGTWTIEF